MTATGPTTRPPDDPVDEAGVKVTTADRAPELRLARLHLRTGAYGLARAELETLAGSGTLDDEALLDLAEVRWRTDDLTGAGEAAAASIAGGRIALIALVVAAEATAALGRPGEARRLAGRALELVDGAIDPVFAGMPRSDIWPAARIEHVGTPATATLTEAATAGRAIPVPTGVGHAAQPAPVSDPARSPGPGPDRPPVPAAAVAAVAVPMAVATEPARDVGDPMPDPQGELAAARSALAAGDRTGAAIRLSIVLRLAPSLAPAVLDLAAAEPGPEFDLVRGDALRLVGRESQARRAFASAAARRPATADPASGSGSSAAGPGGAANETAASETGAGSGGSEPTPRQTPSGTDDPEP